MSAKGEFVPVDYSDEGIQRIVDRVLDYFDPLSVDEIQITILSYYEWTARGFPMQTVGLTFQWGFGRSTPQIFLREDFVTWPSPVHVIIHEVSHVVDYVVQGWSSDYYDQSLRNPLAYFIMEKEGWRS